MTIETIESSFATIRRRSDQAKSCVRRNTMLAMLYKLGMSAQKRWRRIRGLIKLHIGVMVTCTGCHMETGYEPIDHYAR